MGNTFNNSNSTTKTAQETKTLKYIDVNLTQDVIGSKDVAEYCLKNENDYYCRKIQNNLFLMLNEKYFGKNDVILRNIGRFDHMMFSDAENPHGDYVYHVNNIKKNEYYGNQAIRIEEVITRVKQLERMNLHELSNVNGINVPLYMLKNNTSVVSALKLDIQQSKQNV